MLTYNIDMQNTDDFFMLEALKEASRASEKDEVPVGAVIVHKGRIIARAYNQIKMLKDPTAHAEMIAITQAAAHLQTERILDTTIYVTVEPCAMCAGALVLGRVKKIVYGTEDPKTGACGSVMNVANNKKLNHQIEIIGGFHREDCASLLHEFFKKKRTKADF